MYKHFSKAWIYRLCHTNSNYLLKFHWKVLSILPRFSTHWTQNIRISNSAQCMKCLRRAEAPSCKGSSLALWMLLLPTPLWKWVGLLTKWNTSLLWNFLNRIMALSPSHLECHECHLERIKHKSHAYCRCSILNWPLPSTFSKLACNNHY